MVGSENEEVTLSSIRGILPHSVKFTLVNIVKEESMPKLAIYYELDDAGKDTGRVQVVDEDEDLVLETLDTEEEAEKAMARIKATDERNEKITQEYLEWEKACLTRHKISQDELREYLVNVVII
jgi:hypothetical protein